MQRYAHAEPEMSAARAAPRQAWLPAMRTRQHGLSQAICCNGYLMERIPGGTADQGLPGNDAGETATLCPSVPPGRVAEDGRRKRWPIGIAGPDEPG